MKKNVKKICLLAACFVFSLGAFGIKAVFAQECAYYCDPNPDYDCILKYTDGSSTYCSSRYPNSNVHVPIINGD